MLPLHSAAQVCHRKVDLVFAMDSSGSISHREYIKQKRFVQLLTRKFKISPSGTHVGVVAYSDKATTKISLNKQNTWMEHVRAVDRIRHIRKETRIDLALKETERVFHLGGRKGIPKIAIFLTDGQQSAVRGEIPELDKLVVPLKKKKIKVYAIGVGRYV